MGGPLHSYIQFNHFSCFSAHQYLNESFNQMLHGEVLLVPIVRPEANDDWAECFPFVVVVHLLPCYALVCFVSLTASSLGCTEFSSIPPAFMYVKTLLFSNIKNSFTITWFCPEGNYVLIKQKSNSDCKAV